jgi:sugar O-acyltransferase (sialic acid O-acetyltransferase NeuD family)
LIIGAGGFGREVLEYARDIIEAGKADWGIAGFLDDNACALDNYECEQKILGSIKEHEVRDEYVYICAIGDPETKLSIGRKFHGMGAVFINIIHPTAYVGRNCKMGVGVVLCPRAVVTADVEIGSFVAVDVNSICSHDSKVADGCTISHFCDLTGFTTLGEGVFLGSGVSVCPGVTVGDYAKIGAGSVALKDIDSGALAYGVPAKTRR